MKRNRSKKIDSLQIVDKKGDRIKCTAVQYICKWTLDYHAVAHTISWLQWYVAWMHRNSTEKNAASCVMWLTSALIDAWRNGQWICLYRKVISVYWIGIHTVYSWVPCVLKIIVHRYKKLDVKLNIESNIKLTWIRSRHDWT